MKYFLTISLVACTLQVAPATAQQYKIDRANDGPFSMKLLGVQFNEGSSLQREQVVLNTPSCPIQVVNSTLTFSYEDRGFKYKTKTNVQVTQPVAAFEIRHVLYDVFGRHMQNLSNVVAKDYSPGQYPVEAVWNAFRENDVSEHLTTVTYVANVRLADGKIWTFQVAPLLAALGSLSLEQKVDSSTVK